MDPTVLRSWQHQIELLQTIPGVGPKVAEVFIAETGVDMSRFPTAPIGRLRWFGSDDERVGRGTGPGR